MGRQLLIHRFKQVPSGGFTVFYIYGINKENNVNVISN
jgi:hypothetical protein